MTSRKALARSAGRVISEAGLLRRLLYSRQGRIGVSLLTILVIIAIFGRYVAPYEPTAIGLASPFSGPSVEHFFGTDALGRDVLSRFLWGGASLLYLSILTTLVTMLVGVVVGMTAGYLGGLPDQLISRAIDVFISLPPLLMVLLFVAALGTSPVVLVVVVALFSAPRVARIVRGATQSIVANEYIESARSRGESSGSIILRELLPNISGPLLAETALRFTYTVIFITTLNFLGLGVQPPTPDWGLMVNEGRVMLTQAPLVTLVPAAAIVCLGVGANLISDEIALMLSPEVSDDVEL